MKFLGQQLCTVGLCCCIGAAGAGEQFASLARIEGSVLINQGEQYISAREGMGLKTGDRLMVMSGGSVVISYDDGCKYTLGENRVLTIGKSTACSGEAGTQHVGPSYAAIGSPAPAAASLIVPGGMGVAGVVGGFTLDTGGKPISP